MDLFLSRCIVLFCLIGSLFFLYQIKCSQPDGTNKVNTKNRATNTLRTHKPLKWHKILHFLPHLNQQDPRCLNLFKQSTFKDFPPEYRLKYKEFEAKLKEVEKQGFKRSPSVEGRTVQINAYMALAKADFVKTVCEVGFNAGHSAITWLTAKPDLYLHTFDIAINTATKPMAKYIAEKFPGRFNITYGDSLVTVPQWVKKGIKCDIISVDGGHTYELAFNDLRNMKGAAADHNILVADDVHHWAGVRQAWRELVKSGIINEKLYCAYGIGHY